MKPIRLIALVLVVTVFAVGAAAAYVAYSYPELLNLSGAPGGACPSGAIASGQSHITIVISSQGFNGSGTSSTCPIVNVAAGQSVTIHVVNNDRETHGFAITHYLLNGESLQPGQSSDVTFTADQVGNFQIYCNIPCFPHHLQQNGRLNVT